MLNAVSTYSGMMSIDSTTCFFSFNETIQNQVQTYEEGPKTAVQPHKYRYQNVFTFIQSWILTTFHFYLPSYISNVLRYWGYQICWWHRLKGECLLTLDPVRFLASEAFCEISVSSHLSHLVKCRQVLFSTHELNNIPLDFHINYFFC